LAEPYLKMYLIQICRPELKLTTITLICKFLRFVKPPYLKPEWTVSGYIPGFCHQFYILSIFAAYGNKAYLSKKHVL
jgi:hypothetical protein